MNIINYYSVYFRILDNMPVTWCYQVEGQAQPVCERGFPLGCYVTKTSKRKDTCRLNVSIDIYFIPSSETSIHLKIVSDIKVTHFRFMHCDVNLNNVAF